MRAPTLSEVVGYDEGRARVSLTRVYVGVVSAVDRSGLAFYVGSVRRLLVLDGVGIRACRVQGVLGEG